jgi:hypothetical protein
VPRIYTDIRAVGILHTHNFNSVFSAISESITWFDCLHPINRNNLHSMINELFIADYLDVYQPCDAIIVVVKG